LKKLTVLKAFMRRRLINHAFPSVLVLAVVLGACGCGKKATQQAAPQPAPAPEAQTPTATPQQSQAVAQPSVPANGAPDLADINRNLIRWVVGHKRRPANFEEFAATAGAPIPPAPAGKKYIIAPNMSVQLVNQ
jgi:hypothetical protein